MADQIDDTVLEVIDAYLGRKRIAGLPLPVVLLEAHPKDRVTGAILDVRASYVKQRPGHPKSREYRTRSTDTPADTRYPGRLVQPYAIRASIMSGDTIGARAGLSEAALLLDISDPAEEHGAAAEEWIGWTLTGRLAWEGAEGSLLIGALDWTYDQFKNLRSITIAAVEWDRTAIKLHVRDVFEDLREKILRPAYAGTGGVEGTAEDHRDVIKPFAFGPGTASASANVNINVSPVVLPLIAGQQVYQFHFPPGTLAGGSVEVLYEGGIPLVADTDYTYDDEAHVATLEADASFPVTADIRGFEFGETTLTRSHVIEALLLHVAGYESGDLSTTLTGSFRTDAPNAVAGWFEAGEEISYEDLFNQLMAPLGYWLCTRTGKLGAAWLQDPNTATPGLTLDWQDIKDDGRGGKLIRRLTSIPPHWKRTLKWGKVYTVQTIADLAGAATGEQRSKVSREWRQVVLEDAGVLASYPLATDWPPAGSRPRLGPSRFPFRVAINFPTFAVDETFLTSNADAVAEAKEAWAIYSRPRDVYEVELAAKWFSAWVGEYVELGFLEVDQQGTEHDVFGFDSSGSLLLEDGSSFLLEDGTSLLLSGQSRRRFLIVGIEEDLGTDTFKMTLWG